MASTDRVIATLRYRHGGTAQQAVPYPLPEGVMLIAQVSRDPAWTVGTSPSDKKWGVQVFLLEQGSGESPNYVEDQRQPEPTYENAAYTWLKCRQCNAEHPVLFANIYPRQIDARPEDVGKYCYVHFVAEFNK